MSVRPRRLAFARSIGRHLPPAFGCRLTEVLYPAAAAARDDYIATTRSITGSRFRGPTSDYYGHHFAVAGHFAWKNWAIAAAVCGPGSTIIEIGANVGTETLAYRDVVGPRGHVYAIEPVPQNQKALTALIDFNGWTNVEVIPVALDSRSHRATFSLPPLNNSGAGYLASPGQSLEGDAIEVECVTLDSLAQSIGSGDLVVSDTEGAELEVLRGARAYLRRHRPVYVVEVDPRWLARAGAEPTDLLDELITLGYETFLLRWFGLRTANLRDCDETGDLVAVPRGRREVVKRITRTIVRAGLMPPVHRLNPLVMH